MEVAVGTRGKRIGRGQSAAVIRWPKVPQCRFSFTHMCQSCTSPGALCSWAVPCRSPGRCCRGQQLSPQRGMSQSVLGAGRVAASAKLVEMVGSRVLFAAPFSEHFTKAGAAPGDFEVWSLWSRLQALVCLKMRPSFCAAKMLKMSMTSALTNSNNLLLLSLKLAKYFTPL